MLSRPRLNSFLVGIVVTRIVVLSKKREKSNMQISSYMPKALVERKIINLSGALISDQDRPYFSLTFINVKCINYRMNVFFFSVS